MQKNYLMGLIDVIGNMCVIGVQRRRHGSYIDPSNCRRQASVVFHILNGKGENVQVCRQTFLDIFGTTKSQVDTWSNERK